MSYESSSSYWPISWEKSNSGIDDTKKYLVDTIISTMKSPIIDHRLPEEESTFIKIMKDTLAREEFKNIIREVIREELEKIKTNG